MSRQPRVLLIPRFGPTGGTRSYFRDLLHWYKRQSYHLSVALSTSQMDPEIREWLDGIDCSVATYREHRSSIGRAFPFSVLWEFMVLTRLCFRTRPDLVVISSGRIRAWLVAFLFPVRLILVQHSSPDAPARKSIRHHLESALLRARLSTRRRLVTVSRAASRALAVHFGNLPLSSVSVVYNHGSESLTRHDDGAYAPSDPSEPCTVLTIGQVVQYKDPLTWIAVARMVVGSFHHEPVRFVWAGDGPLLSQCRQLCEDTPSIRFIGHHNNPAALYRSSHIYFHPSRKETLGIAVLDAMWHSLPVVASAVGGLTECVCHGDTGFLVPPGAEQQMADHLMELLRNTTQRTRMGESGNRRYTDHFAASRWDTEMKRIHQELLNAR